MNLADKLSFDFLGEYNIPAVVFANVKSFKPTVPMGII